jgi:hypothetical protein
MCHEPGRHHRAVSHDEPQHRQLATDARRTRTLLTTRCLLLVFREYAMSKGWSQSFIAQSSDLFGRLFVSF